MSIIQNYTVYETASDTMLEFTGQLLGFGSARSVASDSNSDCQVRIYDKFGERSSENKQYVGSAIITGNRNTANQTKQKMYICSDSLDEVVMWFFSLDENISPHFQGFHIVISALDDAVKDALDFDRVTSYELRVYFQVLQNRMKGIINE